MSIRPLETSRLNRTGLPAGTPAPTFRLPGLDGAEVSLDDYRGRRVLLVFSDPGCGPCNYLAPHLEQLHRDRSDLQVLMLSRGDPEANKRKVAEHGLTFPVLLQRHWEISREYGMFATPIAYLIDEHGVIAADVATGPDAILALAWGKEVAMHERIRARLAALRQELETGQVELQQVERRQAYLRETLLRISGAVQVLEELLADGQPAGKNGVHPGEPHPVTGQASTATVEG